jgi:hypothetical protein
MLATSVFFDKKWFVCAAHAFFGTKNLKLPHIYVLIPRMPLFFKRKKKKGGRAMPKGVWGWFRPPPFGFLGVAEPPPFRLDGAGRATPFGPPFFSFLLFSFLFFFSFFHFFFKKKKKKSHLVLFNNFS